MSGLSANFSIYTMCNDFRFNSLLTLLESNRLNGNRQFKVIPFDDDIDLIKSLCLVYDAELVNVDSKWDDLGKTVYGNSYYRPKVSAWRYFRKFNVFNEEDENFLFLDSNVVLFEPLDQLVNCFDLNDIAFANRSASGRNFTDAAKILINKIDPYIKEGFNAGFWLANSSFMDELESSGLATSCIRELLTLSPEQSFLSLYACMTGKKVKLIRDLDRSFVAMTSAENDHLRSNSERDKRKVLSMKWSGKYYHNDEKIPSSVKLFPFVKSAKGYLDSKKGVDHALLKAVTNFADELGI